MRYSSEAQRVIVTELERYLRQPLSGKKRIAIPCPFHQEVDPSLYINLEPKGQYPAGSYLCFGCRAKPSTHGGWNGLAARLGLATISGDMAKVTEYVPRELDLSSLYSDEDGWDREQLLEQWNCPISIPWPEYEKFRGLPGWLIRKVGGWQSVDEAYENKVCLLPQWNGDVLTGAVKARCKVYKTTKMKYISAPGEWVKTHALFPFHLVSKMLEDRDSRDVFLVEGSRDALRLIGCGLPALAILGTNNWSDLKRDLLMTLDPDRVFTCFDNDSAGDKAHKLVLPTLKGYTKRIRLRFTEPNDDPGKTDINVIREWKKRYELETTSVRNYPDFYPHG